MAIYTIKHICGHTRDCEIAGENSDYIAQLSGETDCPDCFYAKQEEQIFTFPKAINLSPSDWSEKLLGKHVHCLPADKFTHSKELVIPGQTNE